MFTTIGDGTGLAWELARLRLAREDAERSAWLAQRCRRPDRDEASGPRECEVCKAAVDGPGPKHYRAQAVTVCDACHGKGWSRSTRCECGKPLHHRDWPRGGRKWTACAECRAAQRQKDGKPGRVYTRARRAA